MWEGTEDQLNTLSGREVGARSWHKALGKLERAAATRTRRKGGSRRRQKRQRRCRGQRSGTFEIENRRTMPQRGSNKAVGPTTRWRLQKNTRSRKHQYEQCSPDGYLVGFWGRRGDKSTDPRLSRKKKTAMECPTAYFCLKAVKSFYHLPSDQTRILHVGSRG